MLCVFCIDRGAANALEGGGHIYTSYACSLFVMLKFSSTRGRVRSRTGQVQRGDQERPGADSSAETGSAFSQDF